ncbi:hypothetical protein KY284_020680 [Solanum tuberosum]|nr:hypothetical protein KY284_020680 [Solanum tuberosum]
MEDSTNVIPTIHYSDVPIEEFVHTKEVEDAVHKVTQLHTKVLSCDKDAVDSIKPDSERHASNPDSSKAASIPSGTEIVIDAIVYKLPNEPINVAPLSVIIPPQLTNNDDFLSDSQLPTQLPIKKSAHNLDTKTPAPRNRIPSKILQSPYVNTFGSIDKGKGKIDDDIRPYTPFEECGITYQVLSLLMQEYSQWIQKGLLKTHANNKSYSNKGKNALFGFDYMDFVVAFPLDKNWFYTMSQPKKCWTDQHIDVIFYYLRKKSKLRSMDQYRYTTCNCLFNTYIKNAYKSDCGTYVAAFAEFLSNEIKVPSIPFQSEYLRSRYATLLWKYGTNKANAGYVSENDDHIRLKAASILLADDELFNVE